MLRRLLAALAVTGVALAASPAVDPAAAAGVAPAPPQGTWHADAARVPEARAAGRDGRGVVVAVLDSWVDDTHPDLRGRVSAGADCLGGTCRPGPARADACDHGTHVAGTVGASSFGVAPAVTILPVRVLAFDTASSSCLGEPDDVAVGIRWAVAQGARVLNLSLGPDIPGLAASSALPAAVRAAAEAGALVVFSAGNSGAPLADAYGEDALVVSATGPDGTLADYSQRGLGVDLAAPGGQPDHSGTCTREDCVTSLFPGGQYAVAAGTSMAAPHVSGAAALLLGQQPSRSRSELRALLLDSARPLPEAGAGSLDAAAALGVQPVRTAPVAAAAQSTPEPVPSPAPAKAVPTLAAPSAVPTTPPPPAVPVTEAPDVPLAVPAPLAARLPAAPGTPSGTPLLPVAVAAALVLGVGSGVLRSRR